MQRALQSSRALSTSNQYSNNISDENIFQRNCSTRYRKFIECWSFFSSPRNLQKITPTDMGFEITDYDGKSVYPGVIQYKVRPLFWNHLNLDDGNYSCKGE
jgi:hypothetical protein